MGKYKVSLAPGKAGVSNTAFRLGRRGQDGTVEGRVGDEVELSDEQLKQLERSPFEFTAVDGTEPSHQEQQQQAPQESQDPQPASEQTEIKQ